MIVKHSSMKTASKSSFKGLAEYITDSQNKDHRIGLVNITNCETENLKAAINEITATQKQNVRAKGDKTYHMIVSFRAGENLSDDVLRQIEERICEGLGFKEHQRISSIHKDTDNLHIHIAVNKIHPKKLTLHEPYQSYRKLSLLCDELEDKHSLEKDNHEIKRTISQGRARDMERHSGIESLITWVRKECLPDILSTKNWQDLHNCLADNSLTLKKKGNGFVIETFEGLQVKASSISRELSKGSLSKKFGDFDEPKNINKPSKRKYTHKPTYIKIDTSELYSKYLDEKENIKRDRLLSLGRLRSLNVNKVENAKRSNNLRLAAIKLMGGSALTKKILYAQARKSYLKDIKTANENYAYEKKQIYKKSTNKTWADWLKERSLLGDEDALNALRNRHQKKPLKGNVISGEEWGHTKSNGDELDSITKKGTKIIKTNGGVYFDDGKSISIPPTATNDLYESALKLAEKKNGNNIILNGSPEFKAKVIHVAASLKLNITFSDPELELKKHNLIKNKGVHQNDRRRENRTSLSRTGERRGSRGRGSSRSGYSRRYKTARRDGGGRYGANTRDESGNVLNKPNIAKVGGVPPSFAKNHLRTMSKLGVVSFTRGGEMLLPSNVSSELEHKRTQSNNGLRWSLFGRRVSEDQTKAALKYIDERLNKKDKGLDIQNHTLYNDQYSDEVIFSGVRNVDGQYLALLKVKEVDGLAVFPITASNHQRLSKIKLGEQLYVSAKGTINKTRGRGIKV